MFDNLELDQSQIDEMKKKAGIGLYRLIAKRISEYRKPLQNGAFVVIPDLENEPGNPVVTFVGLTPVGWEPSGVFETWTDVIMKAHNASMNLMERKGVEIAFSMMPKDKKDEIFQAITESGQKANKAIIETTWGRNVCAVVMSEDKDEVSFFLARLLPGGIPGRLLEKVEII